MRLFALLPIVLCTTSLILTILALFAGSQRGFMEDYALVTLNTSRIGQELFNTSETSSNPVVSFFHNITNHIESDLQSAINSIAKELGLHDFYSAHILDHCEGFFTPGPVPNATLSMSSIQKNVTSCSNRTSSFHFNPREILQNELNKTGHGKFNLTELHWPSAVDKGLATLKLAANVTFVLYCIAIGFIGLAILLSAISIFLSGRISAFLNVSVDWFASLALGIASAIATALASRATHIINKYGNAIGVSATKGTKFITLTWVATGLLLAASMLWCFECIVGRKRRSKSGKAFDDGPKYG